MKILFVSHSLYPCKTGGAEIFNFFLLKALAKYHKIYVLTCCKEEMNVDATLIQIEPKAYGPATISIPLLDFAHIFKLRKEIDLIHISYMGAKLLPWIPFQISKLFFNIPYIITIHGGGMHKWKAGFLHQNLFRNADAIVGVSQKIKKEYEKRTDRPIEFIPPLLPFRICDEKKYSIRKKYGMGFKEKILLSLGSIKKIKGSDTLLEAFINLGRNFLDEHSLRLFFVGDGEMKNKLQAYAEQKNFSNYVSFLGNIPYEKIPSMYRMADVYIIPSLFEGTPISLLEAMFNGMPIIGSDTNGINNIIDHGKIGLLFEKSDMKDLTNKIKYLIENEIFANELASEAKKLFKNEYSFERVVNQYIEIYNKLNRDRSN